MSDHDIPMELPVEEARRLLDAQPGATLLLDVREASELAICHIAGAVHIPMREIPGQLDTLPRDRHILVLCHHGGRSQRVTQFLRHHGFAKVSNIDGGINAWAEQIDPALERY